MISEHKKNFLAITELVARFFMRADFSPNALTILSLVLERLASVLFIWNHKLIGMRMTSNLLVWIAMLCVSASSAAASLPNIVLIMTDDQGYSDVGVFGAKGFQTPHLDRLARDGRRFTDFYVAASVCTASRAALMTGCYPNRVSMFGALNHTSREGLHPDEVLRRSHTIRTTVPLPAA